MNAESLNSLIDLLSNSQLHKCVIGGFVLKKYNRVLNFDIGLIYLFKLIKAPEVSNKNSSKKTRYMFFLEEFFNSKAVY